MFANVPLWTAKIQHSQMTVQIGHLKIDEKKNSGR